MEEFLDYLCGKSGYMILCCQKVTKEELKCKLISCLEKESKNESDK